jgi:starch synthase
VSISKDKIWIFTFEYTGIVKVGGLGEVPANQAKHLIDDFDITVFIPSHGQIQNLKRSYQMQKLPIKCVGLLNPSFQGENEPENTYNIAFYQTKIMNVNIIIISGENSFTRKFLDDPAVYNPDTLSGKICLFSLGLNCFINYLIDSQKEDLPDIIHLHDYHCVIPYIGVKQTLNKNNLEVHSIITIHLLTWPRYSINFYRECKIDDTPIQISLNDSYKSLTLNEIFMIARSFEKNGIKNQPPTVEMIGCIVCDMVTTVSQSYLISDIIPNCGNDLIGFKSDFIWDGCDWNYNEIFKQVLGIHGKEMRKVLKIPDSKEITLLDMKKFLLTHKITHLDKSPLIRSKKVLKAIHEISDDDYFMKNGSIRHFDHIGPLVITTGRISHQKGFDIIFNAIPKVIKVIPNAKFLFLILPTDYSLEEIKTYAQIVKKYPDNLRIIFGVASDIFHLAHLSADVYCAVSRWEPFGIIALEAMASKLPIIATRVGGFQETVIDIRNFWEIGTGILIEKDSVSQFANALISMFIIAGIPKSIKERGTIYEAETLKMVNQIPDEIIKSLVLLDPDFYLKIRENCYKRVVNNFRWNIVSKKLSEFYTKIIKLHL